MTSLTVEDFHIGWICALSKEMTASKAALDERYDNEMLDQDPQDFNSYALGRIHRHNIAIGCLPAGQDGIAAATAVAKDMARTFSSVHICLLVGIGEECHTCWTLTFVSVMSLSVSQMVFLEVLCNTTRVKPRWEQSLSVRDT